MSNTNAPPSLLSWTLAFMRPYRGRMMLVGILLLLDVDCGFYERDRLDFAEVGAAEIAEILAATKLRFLRRERLDSAGLDRQTAINDKTVASRAKPRPFNSTMVSQCW